MGEAFCISSFQAIQPKLVSREEIPQAALLNSANGNVARAAGPALGGAVIAALGPEATFALNALSFLGVLVVLYTWKRPVTHRPLGSEHIRDAIRAGTRYVRSAPRSGSTPGATASCSAVWGSGRSWGRWCFRRSGRAWRRTCWWQAR